MINEYDKLPLKLRGELFVGAAGFLGLPEIWSIKFISAMSKKLMMHEGSLFNWKKRGFPVKEATTFDELWTILSETVQEFADRSDIPGKVRKTLSTNWTTRADTLKHGLRLSFIKYNDIGREQCIALLNSMGTAALDLPPLFPYKLFKNFDGYRSVTPQDFTFLVYLLSSSKEKRRQVSELLAASEMKPTQKIVRDFMSREGREWWEIRNLDYAANFSGGKNPSKKSWELFTEKALALPTIELYALLALLALIWPNQNGELPMRSEDIDLLLMFKYCLTENGQSLVLLQLEDQERDKKAADEQ